MYKPGDRPADLTQSTTAEDNVPAEGQKGVEVPKTDEEGNPIEVTANSTQVQVNATANTTAPNATLAESNSSIKANATTATKPAAKSADSLAE